MSTGNYDTKPDRPFGCLKAWCHAGQVGCCMNSPCAARRERNEPEPDWVVALANEHAQRLQIRVQMSTEGE